MAGAAITATAASRSETEPAAKQSRETTWQNRRRRREAKQSSRQQQSPQQADFARKTTRQSHRRATIETRSTRSDPSHCPSPVARARHQAAAPTRLGGECRGVHCTHPHPHAQNGQNTHARTPEDGIGWAREGRRCGGDTGCSRRSESISQRLRVGLETTRIIRVAGPRVPHCPPAPRVCVCVYVCVRLCVCLCGVCVYACVRASVRGRACMCVRVYRGLRLRRACGRMRRRAGWVGGGGGDFRPSKGRRYIAPPPMYAAEDVREEGGRRVCAADTHNTYIHTGTQIHTYRSASPPRVCMCARARAFVCVQRRLLRPGP